jgi:hypothetical protein
MKACRGVSSTAPLFRNHCTIWRYQCNRRLGEHQIRSASFGEEKYFLALLVIFPKYRPLLRLLNTHTSHQNNKRESQTPIVNTNLTVLQWEELTFPQCSFFP